MERPISDKEKEMIINFGAFAYESPRMANIIGWSLIEVNEQMKNKDSLFYKYYNEGKDKAEYVTDLKLFEMVQSGDLKALEKFEQRKIKLLGYD